MTSIQKSKSKRNPNSPDFATPTTGVVGLHTKKAIKVIAIVILLAGLIGGGYFAYSRFVSQKSTSNTASEDQLQTAKATRGDLVLYADGTGTIISAAEANLGFSTSGQVSEIQVKVGDTVEAGQVLAGLDSTEAQVKLAEAQEAMNKLTSPAAIAQAQQTLAEAQSSFDTAKETLEYLISPQVLYWEEKVSEREQLLADAQAATQTDPSDAAKQKVSEAQGSLTFAQNSLKRANADYEYYVKQTFTQYRTRRGRGGTKTSVVKVWDEVQGKYVDVIYAPTEGEIAMARADYDLAKAQIGEAQIYLDVLNGAEIPQGATGANLVTYLQTKHALETAEYNLNATRLIAPIRGTVTAVDIQVGDFTDGSSAITISDFAQPYSIDAYLDAKDWGQVKIGYEVEVSFDILPDKVFTGTVTSVYPTLDTTTSSKSSLVHITARLDKAMPYELPEGSSASVNVIGGKAENAVLVPVEALHEIGEDKYTLFVMENGKLRLRVVEVGLQDLTKAEIVSGLDAGDIVTTGVVKTKSLDAGER
jgi:HlyD family secretion protein